MHEWHGDCYTFRMNSRKPKLSLVDMDIGLFVSYELTPEVLITKLFRTFTLNRIPLNAVMELREASTQDITLLNWINWFRPRRKRRSFAPLYTLQTAVNRPRIFMRLDEGSHIEMKKTIGSLHED